MKLRPIFGRLLLGAIGLVGLVGIVIDAMDGTFLFRGHMTTLPDDPAEFWVKVGLFGTLFGGLMLWAISGASFEPERPESRGDQT